MRQISKCLFRLSKCHYKFLSLLYNKFSVLFTNSFQRNIPLCLKLTHQLFRHKKAPKHKRCKNVVPTQTNLSQEHVLFLFLRNLIYSSVWICLFFWNLCQAPRIEAQTILGSLVCFPNLYLQIPILQHIPGSNDIHIGNEDIKVNMLKIFQYPVELILLLGNHCTFVKRKVIWVDFEELVVFRIIWSTSYWKQPQKNPVKEQGTIHIDTLVT